MRLNCFSLSGSSILSKLILPIFFLSLTPFAVGQNCDPPAKHSGASAPSSYDIDVVANGVHTWSSLIGSGQLHTTQKIRISGTGTVIIQNSNLQLESSNAAVVLDGVELILNNGDIQLPESGARFIMNNGILRTYGNFQQSPGTIVVIENSVVEIGDELVGGLFNTTDNESTSANFQNDGGYRYLNNVCINVTHDYQLQSTGSGSGLSGVDVLINVCLEVGDRGENHATPTAFGQCDDDDSGNFQNSNSMSIYDTDIVVANGDYQNNDGIMTICNLDVKINKSGNFQINSGTFQGTGLCVAAEDIIENSANWDATVVAWYSDKQNSLGNIPNGGPESAESVILAECFTECCVGDECVSCDIDCPDDLEIDCNDSSGPDSTGWPSMACESNDLEGQFSYTWSDEVTGECPLVITRTWTASGPEVCDDSDLTCTQTITVTDNEAPILEGVPADETLECGTVPQTPDVTASDNCDPDVSVVMTSTTTTLECGEQIVNTWTAEDNCGNEVSASQTITITDSTAPELSDLPLDGTVECDDIPAPADVTASDVCIGDVAVQFSEIIQGEGCPYEIIRTWTASDDCGNQVSHTQVLEVVDTSAPELIGVPEDAEAECGDEIPDAIVGAIDNCDEDLTVTLTAMTLPWPCGEEFIRTWTTVDDCGNEVSASQTVLITDSNPPVLSDYPGDMEASCTDIPAPPVITASDLCDDDVVVLYTEEILGGSCPYSLERTWTASDDCGNTVSHTQTILVIDGENPQLVGVPVDTTVECGDDIDNPTVTATDNCDTDPTVSMNEVITPLECGYQIDRTWTATDDCGNGVSASQTITVTDTTAPELSELPQDETVECDDIPAPADVTCSDVCDGDLDVQFFEIIGDEGCPYTITRTWFASDECGNQVSHTQILDVVDTSAPELIGVPEDALVECDYEISDAIVVAIDNCDEDLTVTLTAITLPLPCGEEFLRTWTTTDDCGNEVSASQTITIVDTTAPVVVEGVDPEVTVDCDVDLELPDVTPVFGDNCDTDLDIDYSEEVVGDNPCEYDIVRVWTAIDNCTNSVQVTQTVHVIDTTDPVLSNYPADIYLTCEDALPDPPVLTAMDDCDPDVVVEFEVPVEGGGEVDPDADGNCYLIQPESPHYDPDWVLLLPDFYNGYEEYVLDGIGSWDSYDDGSVTVNATVISVDNPNAGFVIELYLENGIDWDSWSNQAWPTSYKDDFGVAGDNYLDWIYYLISNASTLTGWGDFEGSFFELSHAPSNLYYGYQLGVAANNVNQSYGSGGWFNFEGTFVDSSTGFDGYLEGFGDFAFDHDCCIAPTVTWMWTAEDCAGNTVTHTTIVYFSGAPGIQQNAISPCAADFNDDQIIDTLDILIFLTGYDCNGPGCEHDLTGDGNVKTDDLLILLTFLGSSCY